MKRLTALSLTGLLALSTAPDAFAWGAYHGGFGGASYHGAYGGSFSRSGDSWSATGARGSTASGGGGSWSANGFRGGSASGGGGASTSVFPPGFGAGWGLPSGAGAGAAPAAPGNGVLSRTHVTVCPAELVQTTAFFPVNR